MAGDRVVGDHRVDVARGHKEAETWSAESLNIVEGLPVRLCENGNAVSCRFKHARNYGNAKGGMVDVRIPRDVYEIGSVPAAGFYLLGAYGQKFCSEHFILLK